MRLVIVTLCVLAHLASARFIIEQGGLKIKFPASAAQQHQSGFDMSLANFGAPKYGGELVGKLVYVDKDHGHPNTCQPDCKYACQDFSQASPPFMLTPSAPGSSTPTTYIMMVDRGPIGDGSVACKFAEKVWNAQKAGAQGVLVVNFEDKLTTMEAPDEDDEKSYQYLRNITIPAAFITKSSGDALKGLLTSGPQQDGVYASMDWNNILPKAEKVEWEFWSNSNDICGPVCDVQKEFIKEFVPVARELEGNWTTFTPHYIVWVCPDVYRASEECQQQCIHNGRYCTPDPDGDLMAGYSGKDVVQENLRQLCVFRLGNETGRPWVWWEYVTQFGEECTMAKNSYNEECAEKVFIAIGGPNWSSLDKLRSCIGDMDADVNNPIMEAEMLSQQGDSTTGEVFILPTIRINNGQYRGKLGYTEVLRAICAGFNQDAEPTACLRVAEDDCRPGSAGESECRARTDGKTACKNTFSGYSCTCGSGFISHTDTAGQETCLNINECLTSSPEDLNPDCTCERCACQDTFGGYTCIKDIANECEEDYGGCWRGDFTVNGQKKTFHACHDNLETYQTQAAKGFSTLPELHNCQCPPCFTEYVSNGVMTCQPKCDLNTCDEATGICAGTAGDSGTCPLCDASYGTPVYAVVLIVAAALSAVAVAGYAAYRWRLRSAMHQEIRAIMAQYMPLEASEAPNGHANLDARGETRGLTSPDEEL